VAGLYLEGVRDPRDLVSGLEALARASKPLVVLKPDASGAVARASVAHTGVLATGDDVFGAVLHRYGATRARTVEELVDALVVLDRAGPAEGRRVGLLSASGGAAVLATQAAERAGLELPAPLDETHSRLAEILPGFAAVGNPADLTGAFVENRGVFSSCLSAFGADPQYDTLVVVQTVHPPELADRLATNMIDFAASAARPPVVLWIAGEMSAAARTRLRQAGLVVFEDADRCMRALAARANRPATAAAQSPSEPRPELAAAGVGQLPDDRAFSLLAAEGVPVPALRVAASPEEAAAAQQQIGGPVAVKAIGLAHKAREGGLVLDVASAEAAAEAHRRVTEAAARAGGDPARSLVQAQVPRGVELIVGARREPGFGTVLLAGLGGSAAELSCGVSRRLLPLARGEASELVAESGLEGLLDHAGTDARDRVAAAIESVATLAEAFGERLDAIEVNPLVVLPGGGVAAVDVLAVSREREG
jgi:acyl-CoA synthetase (NDP forming)